MAQDDTKAGAGLSPVKRQLLELLLKKEGVGSEPSQTIARRRPSNICPLSFAQQRLWFLQQLEPEDPFYNMAGGVHLKGRLEVWAMQKSLNEVIRRHEMLRTSFDEIKGEAVQIIAEAQPLDLLHHDLRDLPEAERETELRRFIVEQARRPFDLRRAPLLRAGLVHLRADEYVLLLTMHHIISDGWSIGVLVREVATLYRAYVMGEPSPLLELPIQYADYAVWQREWLRGEVFDKQLNYWLERLRGASQVLELPTDRARPVVQTYHGAAQQFSLGEELTNRLRELSRREDVTLFMLLLAAFKVLLYRYTGQEDILVGTPIANRTRREVEGLIGFFVNTLVMRTSLSGNPTFAEFLKQVKEVCLGAYAHQDLPFEKLVEGLKQERDMSRSPVFQVLFVLQNAPLLAQQLPNLVMQELLVDVGTAKFDLELGMEEVGNDIAARWIYNTDLFDASTVKRMGQHLIELLTEITVNPERRVLDFSLSWVEKRKDELPTSSFQNDDQFIFEL